MELQTFPLAQSASAEVTAASSFVPHAMMQFVPLQFPVAAAAMVTLVRLFTAEMVENATCVCVYISLPPQHPLVASRIFPTDEVFPAAQLTVVLLHQSAVEQVTVVLPELTAAVALTPKQNSTS